MKLATRNWKILPRHTRGTGGPRSGVALIITLTIMALLLILATAFMVNMRSERAVSFNYRRQVEARQAALAALHVGIGKMSKFFTSAENANAAIATMGGRFYYMTPGATNDALMFSCLLGPAMASNGSTNYADKINLNGGNYTQPSGNPTQSRLYLPIANPSRPGNNWGPDKVEIWAGYMRSNNDGNRNPRFAFWIDDESSKINISTAGASDLGKLPGGLMNTTNFSSVGTSSSAPYLYARIVQPDGKVNRQASSVDIGLLDPNVAGLSPYVTAPTYLPKWDPTLYSATVTDIDNARHPNNQWQPFLAPDEILGVTQNLSMQDYQAAKFCLTAWSVEKTDFTQLFRPSGGLVPRYVVSNAINTATNVTALTNFVINTCQVASSVSASKFFGIGATVPKFAEKYPDISQPFLNGGITQIVANIASYLTDPTQPDTSPGQTDFTQGVLPVGSTNSSTTAVPSGACGLWKAAYMNEIAVSFAWQPIDPKVKPDTPIRWQLWAAVSVELINPYEIPLPRFNGSYQEQYRIQLDNAASQFKVTVSCSPSVPRITQDPPKSLLHSALINPHSYSAPTMTYSNLTYAWPVTNFSTTNPTPPTITSLNVTLPQQIRQMMENSVNPGLSPPKPRNSIIDWYSQKTQVNVPGGYAGTAITPASLTAGVLPYVGVIISPSSVDLAFWSPANHMRVSITKNDPRVHAWYGPNLDTRVTLDTTGGTPMSARNNYTVNYTGGDTESGTLAEGRSSFVIAESGMRSIGELGFIHTGKPWRSLSTQYYGAQSDETGAAIGANPRAIPDWALLDIFAVNTPPIYGRININTGGWHLGNNQGGTAIGKPDPGFEDQDQTLARSPTRPNLLADWPDTIAQWYNEFSKQSYYASQTLRISACNNNIRYNCIGSPTYDAASVPVAAALNVFPPGNSGKSFRNRLANYITHRYLPISPPSRVKCAPMGDYYSTTSIYAPYFTVAEICELPNMNCLFTGDGTQSASTDADKEDTVRRIINVLTTHGDVFTVHAIGSAESGEARLMAVVERIRDTTVSGKNRFRILQTRWITE